MRWLEIGELIPVSSSNQIFIAWRDEEQLMLRLLGTDTGQKRAFGLHNQGLIWGEADGSGTSVRITG